MSNTAYDIMTIEDVALYLRIPVSSAYKLAQEGKIPGQKVGRHWRFHRDTLENWISQPREATITNLAPQKPPAK